ncbi:MAG: glycosyltransferase family 2 protein [Propionivibrio sp.]
MKIAVVAITYKRPDGLRKLLRGLMRQDLSGTTVNELSIVVVDNDPQGSAAAVLAEFSDAGGIRIDALHEPRPGIPFARNRGMLHAIEDSDYFAFIDDDEYPTPTWLRGLLKVAVELYSDCVLGPVTPVFPPGTPRWIQRSRVFEGWRFPHRAQIFEAATNNVLVRSAFVLRHGIEFDERMQASGGSDYRFFRQCVAAGMVIHWSAEAEVFEDIPRARTTLRWMAQRQIRLGNTFALDARLSRRSARILNLYALGLARAGTGLLGLPTLLLSTRWGSSAAIHLLRGIGIITGIHGYRHQEYAKSRLERERTAA